MTDTSKETLDSIRKIVVNTAWEVKLLHNGYDVSTLEDSNALHNAIEKEFDAAVEALTQLIAQDYIPRQKVIDAIGEDQHYAKDSPEYKLYGEPFEWSERNFLRKEIRAALGITEESES